MPTLAIALSNRLLLTSRISGSLSCSRHLCSRDGNNGDKKEDTPVPGGLPMNKDEYLPKERPWEGPKPDSEILKFPPQNLVNTRRFEVKISDDISHVELDPGHARYRYPQFFLFENPFPERKPPPASWNPVDYMEYAPVEDRKIPTFTDVLVIGGGIVGASIAYFIKKRLRDSIEVLVLEKDMTFSKASTTLAVGGIRQQFSLKENIQMSMFTSKFLRNAKHDLALLDHEPPDFAFNPSGYLMLATEDGAEILLDNHKTQTEMGAYVDVLNTEQIRERFPWLNTDGILLGAHGVQNEGWLDPWSLLVALKGKAEFLGARWLQAEFLDFNVKTNFLSGGQIDDSSSAHQQCQHAIVRLPNGLERQIMFDQCVIAAGGDSGEITKRLGIGDWYAGIRTIPLPVEKRKRYVYVFNCPDAPGLDFPFLVDPSGVYCRREGLGGNFICGKSPTPEQEPDPSNLDDIDYEFFENEIWPVLAHRVKAFERLKIVGAWAGYYDYNYFDQNAIIGKHPYYMNFFWCTGFSGHGIQMAPAAGYAYSHFLTENCFPDDMNLTRLGWERILGRMPLKESEII